MWFQQMFNGSLGLDYIKKDFVESLRVLVVKNPGIPQRWLDIRESFDDNFLATIWNVGSFVFWTQLFGGPRAFLLCPGNN